MIGSIIHSAIDPRPYVMFSICMIVIGLLLEMRWATEELHHIARYATNAARYCTRALAQRAFRLFNRCSFNRNELRRKNSTAAGLTPTQALILSLLRRCPSGLRLSAGADELGITPATVSNAVTSLTGKGLLRRSPAPDDRRAVALTLTAEGCDQADRVGEWPEFLTRAIRSLPATEQAALLRSLINVFRALQENDDIPVQRTCVSCRFFRPNAYRDPRNPHHCAFVGAPFGDRALRLDCAEHEPAEPEAAMAIWQKFIQADQEAMS
jgi:DNA-binding MarR family transcriptional regulator